MEEPEIMQWNPSLVCVADVRVILIADVRVEAHGRAGFCEHLVEDVSWLGSKLAMSLGYTRRRPAMGIHVRGPFVRG